MKESILALMIPLLAIGLGIGTAIVAIVAGHRQRMQRAELRHRERLAAIEKGIEIPADPVDIEPPSMRRPRYLLRGLCWLFVGIGAGVALSQTPGDPPFLWGLVPAGVGLAYLLYYFIEARHEDKAPGAPPTPPPV